MRLERKQELELAMPPRQALQGAAMRLDDRAAHRQPESHTGRLAGNERLEQPFALVLRDARTAVR